jgi:hypothetical protein
MPASFSARILRNFCAPPHYRVSKMSLWFRPRVRHPFYPRLFTTPAVEAQGRVIALSGSFPELEQAAAAGASAQRALLVLNRWNGASLTDAERDRLWTLFQVPAYAMLIDSDGRLVGFECEAQNGFHVPGKPAPDSPLCECGRPGQMLHTEAASTISAHLRLLPVPA